MSEELRIAPIAGHRLQARRSREGIWTKEKRQRFCDHLANSCNVVDALKAVGMGSSGAYRLRDRDPEFAEQWLSALRVGYDRLEGALLRRGLHLTGEAAQDFPENGAPFAEMTLAQAMDLLNKHRGTVTGGAFRAQAQATQMPSSEEVDRLIIDKIAIVRRQMRTRK